MASLGMRMKVSRHYSAGGRKYMEDACVVGYQKSEDGKDFEYVFFAVYDGHGGKEASQFAKRHLLDNIVCLKHFWSDDDSHVLRAIRDGFITTHLAMWKEVDKWPKYRLMYPSTSGTTASIAFIRKGKLYTGHVGDSKIVLGHQDKDSLSVIDSLHWQAKCITTDHLPGLPIEKKRIYESGGLVAEGSDAQRVVWKRPKKGRKCYVSSVLRKSNDFEEVPFLAVSRSLGDFWSYNFSHNEFVVSPEPELKVTTLDPSKDCCLILASDGLWHIMSPWEAILHTQVAEMQNRKITKECRMSSPTDCYLINPSKRLIDKALNRCGKISMRADNISVVTVILDHLSREASKLPLVQDLFQMCFAEDSIDNEAFLLNRKEADEIPVLVESSHYQSINESPGRCVSGVVNFSVEAFEEPHKTRGISSNRRMKKANYKDHTTIYDYESNYNPYLLWWERSAMDDENKLCSFPRWSESASGQTSLSKLASWSQTVGVKQGFKSLASDKKYAHSLFTMHLFSDIATHPKGKEGDNFNVLSHIKAEKRKISRREIPDFRIHDIFDNNVWEVSPWKRKPASCRLGITALKALDEFRLARDSVHDMTI